MKVGDRVMYAAYWLEVPWPGVITGEGEKNGKVVYDVKLVGITPEDINRWGYADQFVLFDWEQALEAS
jgi:hypothetical protein